MAHGGAEAPVARIGDNMPFAGDLPEVDGSFAPGGAMAPVAADTVASSAAWRSSSGILPPEPEPEQRCHTDGSKLDGEPPPPSNKIINTQKQ